MTLKTRLLTLILCLILGVPFLTACSNEPSNQDGGTAPNIEQTILILQVDDEVPLTVDMDGVTWSSENSSVASVDHEGNVRAIKMGSTTIIAEKDGKTDTCEINVYAKKQSILKKVKLYLSREDVETNTIDFSTDNILKSGSQYKIYDITEGTVELKTSRDGNVFSISRNPLFAGERIYGLLEDEKVFYTFDATVVSKVFKSASDLLNYKNYGNLSETGIWDDQVGQNKYILKGYFELGCNIDLSGIDFTKEENIIHCDLFHGVNPSKYGEDPLKFGFAGVFDGQGYTINGGVYGIGGLFGRVATNGVIRNVAFTNATVRNSYGGYDFGCVLSHIYAGKLENSVIEVSKVIRTATWGVATSIAQNVINATLKDYVAYYPVENQDGYYSYSQYIKGSSSAINCYSISGGWWDETYCHGYAYLGNISTAAKIGIKAYKLTDTDLEFTGLDTSETGYWTKVGERMYFKSSLQYLGD